MKHSKKYERYLLEKKAGKRRMNMRYPTGEDPLADADEMYREHILDHYQSPRHAGRIAKPDLYHKELNPSCGDEIELSVRLDKDKIAEAKFAGHGCAISQAAASLLMEKVQGMKLKEAAKITKEDMLELLAIPIGIVRMKCALLTLRTLERAILQHAQRHKSLASSETHVSEMKLKEATYERT